MRVLSALLLISSSCFALNIGLTPVTVIRSDAASGLNQPEAVAFTPSGDYILAANTESNCITFYKQIDGARYETTASYTLSGPESQLNYPHGISISPDSQYLAVANRRGSTITIYKKDPLTAHFETAPIALIGGEESQLSGPDAVCYSPIEDILVVANNFTSTITFYSFDKENYDNTPCDILQGTYLRVPDGLDFSKDGRLLATTSHDNHSAALFEKGPDGYQLVQVFDQEKSHLLYPHSLAFHPLTNDLAITNSQGKQNVLLYKSLSENHYNPEPADVLEVLEMYNETNIDWLYKLKQEGGVKGVAFSPDGKSLAITQNLNQRHLRLPEPVGVIAIYPVIQENHSAP